MIKDTLDVVDGDFFRELANCVPYGELPCNPILYAPTEAYVNALRFIAENPDIKFKLITHNSDKCVSKCDVPDNLIRWYAQNLDFDHPKVEPIPIGLENQSWHPAKRTVLDYMLKEKHNPHRNRSAALCQFNPNTFPRERHPLFNMVMSGQIAADAYYCLNGMEFDIYCQNLLNYKFCLCPRGNGIDTHRLWEAILLGCIPIVKRSNSCYNYREPYPVLFVDSWYQVTSDLLKQASEAEIDKSLFDTKLLTKSYWKERIANADF